MIGLSRSDVAIRVPRANSRPGDWEIVKIFMVDDDKDAVEPIIETLEEYGDHRVTKVSTVREAEAEFSAGSWKYDLFIIDIQIKPGPDEKITEEESLVAGLSLVQKFRARFKDNRILILSNNLYRVPREFWPGDVNTRAYDKTEVFGGRILDILRNW